MENTGAKMKKLAMNFLKTADEKLRNIGKSQSATVLQTQHFTFYKNQPKRDNESPVKPQSPLEQHASKKALDRQASGEADHTGPQLQGRSGTEEMDEIVVLRQLRREKNGHRVAEAERLDLKRRSRSEGPNRRVRQSMDERESGKKQTFDGGGRARKQNESSDTDGSENGHRLTSVGAVLESDSDSDPKKWTKNPLVVRRVKKSEKTKQVEKRFSGTENGVSAKNIDGWVYNVNEDGGSRTGSLGGENSSSRDSGSSTKGSNKYHKLEEMRKKRINLAVTSDEENTPASRISRLRQRALQGGLGDQLKTANAPLAPTSPYSNTQADYTKRDPQQLSHLHKARHPVPGGPGTHYISDISSELRPQSVFASDQQNVGTNPLSQSLAFTLQPYPEPSHNVSPSMHKQNAQPIIAKSIAPVLDFNRGLNQHLPRTQDKQTPPQQTQHQKQTPVRPPPPNNSRPSFYTIPEPNSQTSRAINNSSPEAAVRRFTTQVRMPSTDSVVNSTSKIGMPSGNANQPVTFSNNLRQIQARGSPTPNQELFQSINNSRSAPQFNDAVEMRLKTSRDSRVEPQPRLQKKAAAKSNSFGYSDDTLDELIESNIQYLDSEVDKSKTKKNPSTSVSRSSSLPDPRRSSSHVSSTPSLNEQPTIQVQASNSIQIHVSLPTDHRHSGAGFAAPVIQIAPSGGVIAYKSDYGLDSHLMSQPDVVPRKYSYDSHSRLSRTGNEYYDRDDMSKSDSQLNAQVVMIPSYLGNNSLHPDQAYARGCVSDINLRSDDVGGLEVPQVDMGMFSDVEYDIQVSERVKKWETFMKVQDGQIPNEQKYLNLTTIQENSETDSLMLPSEVRKSVLLSKSSAFVPLFPKEVTPMPPTRPRPFSSDNSLNKSTDTEVLNMFSVESNANRFFQMIPDPQVGRRLGGVQTQSVTSLFHTPVTSRSDTFLSAHELRQQMIANREGALQVSRNGSQTYFPSTPFQITEHQHAPQKDTSLMTRSSNLSDLRDLARRGSRYHDELNEISCVKSDSVINLRRRFGADSAAGTSEDDQWSVSTASAKLSRPSKTSPSHSEADSMDLSSVLSGYDTKIKDTDVWSPNLETTHGVPVSIERVTARTLQTIPFSEDPFWKEIEEMTYFDPSSMAGHLSVSKVLEPVSTVEPVRSEHQVELASPHTSTLPTQPRNNSVAQRDRMQRSKSLYTPNITPLLINVSEKSSSSAMSALDDVLEDISRSSMERKQLSPKKKALEAVPSSSAVSGSSNVPGYLKMKQGQSQPGFKFEGGQFTFSKPAPQPPAQAAKQQAPAGLSQSQTKQPLQFYQQQRKDPQQQLQNRQSQIMMGGVNSYHLDANLLKQKLLSTGLVVETDSEEPIAFKQTRSSSLGAPAPVFAAHAPAAQSYTPLVPKSLRQDTSTQPPLSFISNKSIVAPSEAEALPAAPWAAKQPGPSALYDIQKALAPFESSSYQPDPETLYGTSRLQSFNEPNFNTSKGPHVTATSWTYQPQLQQDSETNKTSSSSSNSLSRLQEVHASMDDLKDLAQNVERKINAIKGKLQSADERSLDSILASLRKLTPEVKSQIVDGTEFDDYYSAKKSKLSDALTELNRIYDDLELSNDGLSRLPERGKHRPYRATKSNDFCIAPATKSEHLRPTQTRISSVFIPGLERSTKRDFDHETESEFDIISKSFQAIVDEVNQSTDLFSQTAENSTLDNVAPETQNQASKIALKLDNNLSVKALPTSGTEKDAAPSNLLATTVLKPMEAKPKGGRFRAKLHGSLDEDEQVLSRGRSKSIPGLESNSNELLDGTTAGVQTSIAASQATVTTAAKSEDSSATPAATSSPAFRQRIRVRPVRDNKIIQDDKVAKKQGSDKASGISQSPHPSPIVSRKIIYNNGCVADGKSHPPPQTAKGEETAEQNVSQQKSQTKSHSSSSVEEKLVHKPAITEAKFAAVSSPGTHKKVPPPTAAKPSARSETSLANTATSDLVTSISMPANGQPNKMPEPTQQNSSKTVLAERSRTGSGQKQASSIISINLAPVVCEAGQSKSSLASSKQDDTEGSASGGQRAKRRIGSGVAMILDKFTTGEDNPDRMKKRPGIKSAPDLIESLIDGEEEKGDFNKETSCLKPEASPSGDKTRPSQKVTKGQAHRPADKRVPVPSTDSSKPTIVKLVAVSSVERKVVDSEVKTSSSGTTTPQPSSPNNKPPQHPWKRQTSDPDKQLVLEAISESVIMSPKFVSKIPRPIAAPKTATGQSAADETSKTQKTDNHQQQTESPRVARRSRPPDRKMQTGTLRDRPHSFHELMSCFEKDPGRLVNVHGLRKCASADQVSTDTILKKVFRSELTPTTDNCLGTPGDKRGAVLKLEMKLKS